VTAGSDESEPRCSAPGSFRRRSRCLASGGEALRLASANNESARILAADIGQVAVVAVDNRDALQGADAVVLALRFGVLKPVIDEIADLLADRLVVCPRQAGLWPVELLPQWRPRT
jgi:predicted dinucleotide-binding enzyme